MQDPSGTGPQRTELDRRKLLTSFCVDSLPGKKSTTIIAAAAPNTGVNGPPDEGADDQGNAVGEVGQVIQAC